MAPPPPKKAAPPPQGIQERERKRSKPVTEIIVWPIVLLTLAALTSPISQSTLAPVFGSIPSAINHTEAVAAAPLLGFLLRWQFRRLPPGSVLGGLAAWAFWIPVMSSYLFHYSSSLGVVYGPALIGFLSCHTIIIGSAYAAAEALEELNLEANLGRFTTPLVLALAADFHVFACEHFFRNALPGLNTLTQISTPVKTQALTAATLAYLSHSNLALFGLPALIHVFSANVHFDSTRTLNNLNTTLHEHDWSIVARTWSNTGYISVVDNFAMGYRALRADHSLLGGEWLLTEQRRIHEGWRVNEPIYAVFEILEAVRLVESATPIPDAEAQALVIGLGIGTAPKALVAHGINTTVVELDPAVHDYATKYFGLPTNHTAVLRDAVSYVAEISTSHRPDHKYDYIIHDVFTGGAEPLALFTHTFLANLRSILTPEGVIAINYAGDTRTTLTAKVLQTIRTVFKDQCRVFRDQPLGEEGVVEEKGDFSNMVIFCRNSPGAITFRQPRVEDFLERKGAERYLLPNAEYEIPFPKGGDGSVLEEGDEGEWKVQQMESAIRHWHIMRGVLPDFVWELW